MLYLSLLARIHLHAAITSLVEATPLSSITSIDTSFAFGAAPAYPVAPPAAIPATKVPWPRWTRANAAAAAGVLLSLWMITWIFRCGNFAPSRRRPGATYVCRWWPTCLVTCRFDCAAVDARGTPSTSVAVIAVTSPRVPRPHNALDRESPPRLPVPQRALERVSPRL